MPSHLTSWIQSGPDGTAVAGEASIGRMPPSCRTRSGRFTRSEHLLQRSRTRTLGKTNAGEERTTSMRAIWKGAVSFGLVNVPIRLYSATENHDVQFRQVHRVDGGRIKYQRVCSI